MGEDDSTDAADLRAVMRASSAHRPDAATAPLELHLPFRGPWLTVRTPAHRVPSHGTHAFGQTFAFDFVAVDARRRTASVRDWRTLVGTEPVDRFIALGRPVLAPVSGRVVAVHDGEVDHEARRSPLSLLAYGATQGTRLSRGIGAVAGNFVVLALEDRAAFIVLAHLQRGSVGVLPGSWVDLGDRVAACGNSGNSTQPHLHLHAMDSPSLPSARGIPIVFRDYESRHPTRGHVARGVPARGEVVERPPTRVSGSPLGP